MTNAGLAFLALSIVIGMAGGADTYSAVTGIIMFMLLGGGYYSGAW
jgi:hypothetical protein